MKGNITIKFNQATMLEAVQRYMDAQFSSKHKVASVKTAGSANNFNGAEFDIEISGAAGEPL